MTRSLTSTRELQELLDEHKCQMPDNVYKNICDLNYKHFNEQNKELTFYMVDYSFVYFERKTNEFLEICHKDKISIVRISTEIFNRYVELTKQNTSQSEIKHRCTEIYEQLACDDFNISIEGALEYDDDDDITQNIPYYREIICRQIPKIKKILLVIN